VQRKNEKVEDKNANLGQEQGDMGYKWFFEKKGVFERQGKRMSRDTEPVFGRQKEVDGTKVLLNGGGKKTVFA